MSQTLSVTAIDQGCVIDHIPAGQAIKVLQILGLQSDQVTLGMNLPSHREGTKDIIKVTDRVLSEDERLQIGILAPQATVNEIADFKVAKKHVLVLPKKIHGLFVCPNTQCITHQEPIESIFAVHSENGVTLQCQYCEAEFDKSLIEKVSF